MLIQEKAGSFIQFFTPAVLVFCSYLIVRVISILVYVLTNQYIDPFEYGTIYLLLLSLFHIIGILIVFFVFIPIFKVRNDQYKSINIQNAVITILMTCFGLTLGFLSLLVLETLLIPVFGSPQNPNDSLTLSGDNLTFFNIILLFVLVSTLIPLWEELTCRRLLIPMLEERGMSPLSGVIVSSVIFAIGHLPNDFSNGNLATLLIHIPRVFIFGLILGFIYIYTRNVFYSVLAHGIANGLNAILLALVYVNNLTLISIYILIFLLILVTGSVIGIYTPWKIFNLDDQSILRLKSSGNILPGLIGLLTIFSGLIFFEIIFIIGLKELIADQLLRNLLYLFPISILLTVLLWLVTAKVEYKELNNPVEDVFK
ncbi:MAG: lysostaphin resistance A-like protein [Candidatus Hermodarchaeota archaeon]